MPSTLEIGNRLVELCRQKKHVQAIDELYAPDITSIEAAAMPQFPQRMQGIDPIRKKSQAWEQGHDIHDEQVLGPFPHGDRFIVFFKIDVTSKEGPMKGQRMQVEEAALYTVKNGKIAQEEFFYNMG